MLPYTMLLEQPEERTKFEQLYRTYRGLMYTVAFQILKNQDDAEDAVHQAFLSILHNMEKISGVNCPKTRGYAVIITERKAIDIIRSRRFLSDQEFDESLYAYPYPSTGEGDLTDAIAKLPPRYRQVILLRHAQGYSTREVAQLLDLSHEAARKLLYRAKSALQNILDEEGIKL